VNTENDRGETLTGDLHAMAWTYAQKAWELQQDGKPVTTGYSGGGVGKNNPALQHFHNVGPIPQGGGTIVGPPVNTPEHSP
jgi:hypothetical protein